MDTQYVSGLVRQHRTLADDFRWVCVYRVESLCSFYYFRIRNRVQNRKRVVVQKRLIFICVHGTKRGLVNNSILNVAVFSHVIILLL